MKVVTEKGQAKKVSEESVELWVLVSAVLLGVGVYILSTLNIPENPHDPLSFEYLKFRPTFWEPVFGAALIAVSYLVGVTALMSWVKNLLNSK